MSDSPLTPERGPIPATIVLTLTQEASATYETDIPRAFVSLPATLRFARLVRSQPLECQYWRSKASPEVLLLHVYFISSSRANSWTEHPMIVQHYGDAFRKSLVCPPETRIHEDEWGEDHTVCSCVDSEGYVIFPEGVIEHRYPLRCITCSGQFSGDGKLESEPTVVSNWATTYAHVDCLWLESGVFEAWSAKQLSEPTSELNQEGLSLRKALEKHLVKPVYFLIRRQSAEEGEELTPGTCPTCEVQGATIPDPPGDHPGGDWSEVLTCEDCRLAFL